MADRQEGVAATDGEGMPTEREWLEGLPEDRDAASGWRFRLNEDNSYEAASARNAYNSMALCSPSYYADSGDHHAYELAREQAAESLDRWRRTAELREILATVYTPEGVELWLAHAEKQGWSMQERLRRAAQLADGAYA